MSAREKLGTQKKRLSPAQAVIFTEYQLKEIELKEREIELRKIETDNNYHYAKDTLKFQTDENKEMRKQQVAKEKFGMIMICVSAILFFAFLMGAMLMNKDGILSDIIKVAGYVFGGGVTGYGIGVHNAKDKKNQIEPT
ncbi:MAG: hypothetical protein ABI462_04090 [Ignavibacteria bacterium]